MADHLQFIWSAFHALQDDRMTGMGAVGGIPFTVIDRFAHRYRIDNLDAFERFADLIHAMDEVYRGHMNKP